MTNEALVRAPGVKGHMAITTLCEARRYDSRHGSDEVLLSNQSSFFGKQAVDSMIGS